MPSATERVHEELGDHGPLTVADLRERLDGLSERELATALEQLTASGELTVGDEGYELDRSA